MSEPSSRVAELRRFVQVDVFTQQALKGNPLAVVVDGAGLDEATMAAELGSDVRYKNGPNLQPDLQP